jgi:hypothetical protein
LATDESWSIRVVALLLGIIGIGTILI